MSDAPLMLGVSGLRGIVGQSLTPEVAARFGRAFGSWLLRRGGSFDRHKEWPKGPLVLVGADGRAGFEPIRDAAMRGLRDAGCLAIDMGIAMTPTIGVLTDHDDADGALIVTASHNPQQWNGLKCLVRGETGASGGSVVSACAPSAKYAAEIVAEYQTGASGSGAGQLAAMSSNSANVHLGAVMGEIGEPNANAVRQRRFRVALDSVNGAGRFAGRSLLDDALHCELRHSGADDNGVFPHPPEPTRENLTSLCDAVRAAHADIGFAQDPDADRLAIVDERGEYIGEEYTLALAAESLLSSNPQSAIRNPQSSAHQPVLVTNLSTSRMLDDIAARHSARVIRTPVGEANVVEAMKREKAAGHNVILGGEGNGGVIWPKVTYVRDSLSAMALVLALMARTGKRVSELVADLPSYAIEKRKVDLAGGRKEDAAPAVAKISAAYKAQRLDTQDGIRVDWTRGPRAGKAWLHVRASNTEPIMRLIAEAPTAAEAKAILDEAASVIAR
jgi:phosphomannomutase